MSWLNEVVLCNDECEQFKDCRTQSPIFERGSLQTWNWSRFFCRTVSFPGPCGIKVEEFLNPRKLNPPSLHLSKSWKAVVFSFNLFTGVCEGGDATREAEPAGHLQHLDQVRHRTGLKPATGFPLWKIQPSQNPCVWTGRRSRSLCLCICVWTAGWTPARCILGLESQPPGKDQTGGR